MHHVVIVGGGFGGLECARRLRKSRVKITLVDRRNFHLFQPLLYQVATGGLSPGNIATPLRYIVRKQQNCEVLMDEAQGFDLQRQEVVLSTGRLAYDTLVVAAGSMTSYFGNEHWQKFAPGLKSLEDAAEIRRRVFTAFEVAERETEAEKRNAFLTFAVVGGGPTGVELAGTLSEIAKHTLTHDFRNIDPSTSRIILVDAGPKVLVHYAAPLPDKASQRLAEMGIELRSDSKVIDVTAEGLALECDGKSEFLQAATVLWAAGVKANPLGKILVEAAGGDCDRMGRVCVSRQLVLPGTSNVYAIGDIACCMDDQGKPLPGLAPVAIQQARFVARSIANKLCGKESPELFQFRDPGTMATLGRGIAVADIRGRKFCGYFAWILWLFVHLMQIVQFENRILVLLQWMWNYITFNRSARLITETPASTKEEGKA